MEQVLTAGKFSRISDMTNLVSFIVIDDDPLNNTICRLTIKKAVGVLDVKTFTDPLEGLRYVSEEYPGSEESKRPTFLFLDINMPVMNGWEFLEQYERLGSDIRNAIKLYILSSSVDDRDIERAGNNANIVSYLAKPITKEIIADLVNQATNK